MSLPKNAEVSVTSIWKEKELICIKAITDHWQWSVELSFQTSPEVSEGGSQMVMG